MNSTNLAFTQEFFRSSKSCLSGHFKLLPSSSQQATLPTMKKSYLLFLLIWIPLLSHGQRTAVVGLSTGVVNYMGDLGNEKYFPFSSASPGAAVTLRNFLGGTRTSRTMYRPFDLQVRLSWHRLQYDETSDLGGKKGTELRNYNRGINFRNDLFGTEVGITYTIYPNKMAPLWKPKFCFFFMAGIGAYFGKPKADLFNGSIDLKNKYYFWKDGTIRDVPENKGAIGNVIEKDGDYETSLHDWLTEGQGYNREIHSKQPYDLCNLGFPVGAGIRYIYSKELSFSAEFNYYYFLTDYLDDVSGRYATFDEIQSSFPDPTQYELARYISDPSGLGTSGYPGPATSPRGNPGQSDSFTYVSIEASYKFTWKKKGIYGQ